jgi:ATP-dependent RNA helicase DeaD
VAINGDGAFAKLIASGGRAAGLAESDLISAVAATGLDGEAIRNVRLLDQFMLFEVPADQAARVAASVDGTDVRGHTLRLELAKG